MLGFPEILDRFLRIERPLPRCLEPHPLYKGFLCTATVGHRGAHSCRILWESLPGPESTELGKEGQAG